MSSKEFVFKNCYDHQEYDYSYQTGKNSSIQKANHIPGYYGVSPRNDNTPKLRNIVYSKIKK